MHEGGRIGNAETDMLGVLGEDRDVGAHVLSWPADAPAHGLVLRSSPGARDAGAVAEEQHVDAAALGDAGDLLEHADIRIEPAGPGTRHAPAPLEMGPRQNERRMED